MENYTKRYFAVNLKPGAFFSSNKGSSTHGHMRQRRLVTSSRPIIIYTHPIPPLVLLAPCTKMPLKELNFITGNCNKLAEVKAILGDTISLESQSLLLPEIQGTIEEIALDKCRRAADIVGISLVMCTQDNYTANKIQRSRGQCSWKTLHSVSTLLRNFPVRTCTCFILL